VHVLIQGQDVPTYKTNAIVTGWVVGALVAGGCEGVISTVVFGEAAAVKADRVREMELELSIRWGPQGLGFCMS